MSVPVSSTSQHFAVSSGIARDQAESLARGNSRPDDGFWRGVFQQAGGQAGMAGAGVAILDGTADVTQAWRQAMDKPLPDSMRPPSATGTVDAGPTGQGERGPFIGAAQLRTPQGTGAGFAPVPHRTVVSGHPAPLQAGLDHGQSADAPRGAQSQPGGGLPQAAARLPAPVVVTVAAASSDEWRVYLRGQGLTPARALAMASQAVACTDKGAEGAPSRHVVSVVLNGHAIYSTGGQGGEGTSGSSAFSLTA